MKLRLSLVMITYNAEKTLEKTLSAIKEIVDEVVIVDSNSTDKTIEIAKKFNAKIYSHQYEGEGRQRHLALQKAAGDWILILDDDEVVSSAVKKEILQIINNPNSLDVYYVPFQSVFFGKVLKHGGESYTKLILFRKDSVTVSNAQIHAVYQTKNNQTGCLKNAIYHYSYRSLTQLFGKFTGYALREAKQKKQAGESASLKKLIVYPLHMFWSRFVADQGYKDGLIRLPVDIAFAYKEFLMYFFMIWI